MKYRPPRITRVQSMLDQAFGTTCGAGDSAGGSDICWTGSSADPGICTSGTNAYQGQCSTGTRAWGGTCSQGVTTGRCSTGQGAFFPAGMEMEEAP